MSHEVMKTDTHIRISSLFPFNEEGVWTLKPSHARAIKSLFGQVGWESVVSYLRNRNETTKSALPTRPTTDYLHTLYGERTPMGIFGSMRKTLLTVLDKYNVDHRYYDQEFKEDYLQAQGVANATINSIISKLKLPPALYGLREEVTATSDNVWDNIQKIFMHPDDIDPTYQHQIIVQQLLSVVALALNKSHRTKHMQNELKEFVNWVGGELFNIPGQQLGATEEVSIYSLHKDTTNWTGEHDYRVNDPFLAEEMRGKTMKKTEIAARLCNLDGKVFKVLFDTRKKSDSTALIKTLAKALGRKKTYENKMREFVGKKMKGVSQDDPDWNEKIHQAQVDFLTSVQGSSDPLLKGATDRIDILDDVIDIIGTKIVVLEGDKDEFADLFDKKLKAKYGKQTIIDDSSTDTGRGQSKRHSFTRKVIANGIGTEIIIYSLQEYLNSEYDIGAMQQGRYNGASHKIYELQRMASVAKLLFPQEIYPDLDIDKYLESALKQVVTELKTAKTVIPA